MKLKKFKLYKHGGSLRTVGTYKSKKELLPGVNKMVTHSESTLKVVKKKGR